MNRQSRIGATFVAMCIIGFMQAAQARDVQPLRAQVKRVAQVLELLGTPLSADQQAALDKAAAENEYDKAVAAIQRVLDPLCLAHVHINPESRVKVSPGAATPQLAQHGWRVFLVKVSNEAGVTAKLRCTSPNAEPLQFKSTGTAEPKQTIKPEDVPERWMDVLTYDAQPFNESLSGLPLEYRVLQQTGLDQVAGAFELGALAGLQIILHQPRRPSCRRPALAEARRREPGADGLEVGGTQ